MNKSTSLLTGAALGAAAMYLLDPDRGNSRRALVRDKMGRIARVKKERYEAALRDARNRLLGLWSQAANKFSADDASDEAVTARVRSAMGRVVRHPGAIDVYCSAGTCVLEGDVLAEEVQDLVKCVQSVPGVERVDNRCVAFSTAEGVPSLQGLGKRRDRANGMRPGPALATGLLGLGLVAFGATKKHPVGKALGATGMGLALKAMKDLEGHRLLAAIDKKVDRIVSMSGPTVL